MSTQDISQEKNTERANKHALRWIFDLVWEHKLVTIYVVLGIIIHQSLRFVIPVLIGDLVEFGIEAKSPSTIQFYAIAIIIVGLVSAFFDMTMSWGNEFLAASVERDVRSIYFRSIQEKSMAFHEDSKLGELMAIAQNDMRSLYTTLSPGMRIFGEAIVSMVTITIVIFLESWILGIFFLILLPFWYYSLKLYNDRLQPVAVNQQDQFRDLSAQVQENLTGAEVVRAFSQKDREIDQFSSENTAYTSVWEERGKVNALYFPMLVAYFISGLLFIGAAYLAITPQITVFGLTIQSSLGLGSMVTIITLVIQFRGPTFLVGRVLDFASLGLAGVRKIQGILAKEENIDVNENPITKEIEGNVVYESVDFGYTSELVLKDISFTADKGEIIAVVGPTGSGKTTLLKLLTRLYDPTSGRILLDGHNINEYDPTHLRKSIAVVEQDVFLFSTSIRDNITYAVDPEKIDEKDIEHVVKISRVNEFVYDLPEGLETIVGERGVRLSGGQKQRIAIARAFLVDPKILILDDSTSAVDSQTEQEIVSAIKDLMKGRTSFIITTRLNMIRQANKVLVLDNGELIAQGDHDRLIRSNEIYRKIFSPHAEELPPLEVSS